MHPRNFGTREDIAGHLKYVHNWNENTTWMDGDGRYIFSPSELLATHRELHALEPQLLIDMGHLGRRK